MFDLQKFQEIRKGKFGECFHYDPETQSTNRIAIEKAREGFPEGSVVFADSQSQGRGRGDHTWFSPAKVNLYTSVILYPPPERLHYLPFITALALSRTLEEWRVPSGLKWPNDVLAQGKKLAGILIQTSMEENRLQFAVVGIGVNLNVENFPSELKGTAISALQILGRKIDREAFLTSLLLNLEKLYENMNDMSWDELIGMYGSRSSSLQDCEVRVNMDGNWISGVTGGVDPMGGLIVRTSSGKEIVYAGEISSCHKK
jgi:BirA family transcriptional regulator, biotin operon repressor / biotin---[acetyl-CoA-carboxylase] ligase